MAFVICVGTGFTFSARPSFCGVLKSSLGSPLRCAVRARHENLKLARENHVHKRSCDSLRFRCSSISAECVKGAGDDGKGCSNGSGAGGGDESSGTPEWDVPSPTALMYASRRKDRYPNAQTRARKRTTSSFKNALQNIRVSHLLLALNVAIFIVQTLYGPSVLMGGAKVNSAIAAGQYYRLLSPMFLHASITHLAVNSFSLHSTGPSVESWFGRKRFLSLYLASGVAGNALSYFCSPTPAVGASGAIFGLVGATVVILGRHRRILGPRARKGLQSLAYIVLMNFGMGMTPGSRIDNYGHLGGFVGGITFAYMLGPRLVLKNGQSGKASLKDEPILSLAWQDIRERLSYIMGAFKKN